ncbi:MAG: ATP-binding protein [Rhodospirillales bacterium]
MAMMDKDTTAAAAGALALPRTAQGRFLVYLLVSFLVFLSVVLTVFGVLSFQRAEQQLDRRIERVALAQSEVIANSLWHLDYDRVDVVLRAITTDPDIIGASVHDESGQMLASAGTPGAEVSDGIREVVRDVVRITRSGEQAIGTLTLRYGDGAVRAELRRDFAFQVALAFLLLIGALLIAHLIHRQIVMTPVRKLLDAVTSPREGTERAIVNWDSPDEFGTLVRSFNDMQKREQSAEEELRAGRDMLEQAVRERTADLEAAMRDAERANQSKSEFLATMSHEFRTPLNAIIGFSELLRNEILGPIEHPQYKEYVKDIHISGERMLSLVNDVLDIATIEAGKRSFDLAEVDIAETAAECIRELGVAATWKNVQVSYDAPGALGTMLTDRRSLQQILINILSNAVKFTESGGEISLVVTRTDDGAIFTVTDTGIGIPPDMIESLTEPFTQAVSNPHLAREGTGLGLSIVKSLLDGLGGSLAIDSTVGKGTRVTVTVPDRSAS